MVQLIIWRVFAGDGSSTAVDPLNIISTEERFRTEADALDRAKVLILANDERSRKDSRLLPALDELQIKKDDGTTIDYKTVRREALKPRD